MDNANFWTGFVVTIIVLAILSASILLQFPTLAKLSGGFLLGYWAALVFNYVEGDDGDRELG